MIFTLVGGLGDDSAGHWPVADAVQQHHPDMQANTAEQDAGNDKDVKGEEARERGCADDGSAEDQVHERRSDDRHTAGDGCADAETPVCVLIKPHHLTGKGHPKRQKQEQHADDPGEFSRKLVCAEEEDLNNVDEHDGDHEIGPPAMHRTQIPAQGDVVVEQVEAAPRLAGGRTIDQGQQNPRDNLQNEQDRGGTAEYIHPTGVVGWGGMRSGVYGRLDEAETMLKPSVCLQSLFGGACFHPSHGFNLGSTGRSSSSADGGAIWTRGLDFSEQEACVASVGISPAWMESALPSSLYLYSKRPRSGGPEALEPSS